MNTAICIFPDSRAWRELYKAALFELDATKIPERIMDTKMALMQRARELFHKGGDNIEEEQALDDAMYALQAFGNTVKCSRSTPQGSAQDLAHLKTGT
jgi:hypothetical protein